jgi:hypothetical protein
MEMTIPDSYAEPVGPFTLYMEVIAGAGPSQYGLMAAPGCVVSGVMKRGMKLVWRFEVYDLESGRRLTSADDAQVSVQLADGQSLPARFEARGEPGNVPPDAPWTWVAAWSIPLEQPLGPLDYSVAIATPDGRGALIRPSTWGSLAPQIVD